MIQPVLFDSVIYIAALRRGTEGQLKLRRLAPEGQIWLSSVVLEELYAGAKQTHRPMVERLEDDFREMGRVVVPNLFDWTQTGRLLSRLATNYGYEQIGQGRLTNDVLIALSAGRLGITVITTNQRDFSRIAEFAPFHWQVSEV